MSDQKVNVQDTFARVALEEMAVPKLVNRFHVFPHEKDFDDVKAIALALGGATLIEDDSGASIAFVKVDGVTVMSKEMAQKLALVLLEQTGAKSDQEMLEALNTIRSYDYGSLH